jgi:hypothetical protein
MRSERERRGKREREERDVAVVIRRSSPCCFDFVGLVDLFLHLGNYNLVTIEITPFSHIQSNSSQRNNRYNRVLCHQSFEMMLQLILAYFAYDISCLTRASHDPPHF